MLNCAFVQTEQGDVLNEGKPMEWGLVRGLFRYPGVLAYVSVSANDCDLFTHVIRRQRVCSSLVVFKRGDHKELQERMTVIGSDGLCSTAESDFFDLGLG
jgi:hypothetical protein